MDADIKGALEQINKSYKAFEHKGKRMTKEQVKAVLEYGLQQDYKSVSQISDKEVDKILEKEKQRKESENSNLDQKLAE